ncbi:hypothetical protein BO70DRAFT_124748 [Aspergillus heteromorphus CBS 117.55]|uniref:Uncharacterized protein n=1 Tax=Aspergillus heteromorphus CBS 117.55 TaxID=1448321 RepID=A0A317VGF1_9EURO|nr:uncharacterized protein BO70DRAFT_124748 [Aspergillus heteromorphus CBS 117.55]PWY70930.1 hypothetical protein BO70DRAFT_124748 [Aspergillus heteromorphus CBS 117.55]
MSAGSFRHDDKRGVRKRRRAPAGPGIGWRPRRWPHPSGANVRHSASRHSLSLRCDSLFLSAFSPSSIFLSTRHPDGEAGLRSVPGGYITMIYCLDFPCPLESALDPPKL